MNRARMLSVLVAILVVGDYADAQETYPQKQFWRYASPRVEISQTGEASAVHSPACGQGANGIAAVEVVAKAGAAALDAYLSSVGVPKIGGFGITQAALAAVNNQGNRVWLSSRLGINGGQSACATQCVAYPKAQKQQLSVFACLSETGGDGLDCGANGWNGAWMGAWNLTHADTDNMTISCMTGKNWSHNRNRWFWVVATDVNPLSGQALPQVYR